MQTDNTENFMDIPTHISIIMDGNGRWAKKQGKMRLFGHNAGRESVRACTEYCAEKGVRYL
ncbi:MAG: undecaprenyl diphosphate synthase family protein, partial [Bacteroidales bacterium]|nr:undecaprenyl diphosphate synthase family protein [Bacteroidales bacterium]